MTLADGGRVVARAVVRDVAGLRLNVRGGRAVAAYARSERGRWRRVGAPVVAPAGIAADRVVLGTGTYRAVRLRPLR